MTKLFLLRHLKSQWNLENRFTGWTDVSLSKEGIEGAKEKAKKLNGFKIDKVYTSPLKRNRDTVSLILEHLGKAKEDKSSSSPLVLLRSARVGDLPVVADKALDERNYGKLQGLNKDEVKAKYGEEQVNLWRRSWDQAPPEGESLKDVYNRVVPFFKKYIEKDLKQGKNVLVVTSHNSLRAIIKYLEKIADNDIINVEIPFAGLREYELDKGQYNQINRNCISAN